MNETVKAEAIALAIRAAENCQPEDNLKPRPRVGASAVRDGQIIASAWRGEEAAGVHAEALLVEKVQRQGASLNGATVVTTLEPCTRRSAKHNPCSELLEAHGVSLVLVGQLDPNPDIRGKGIIYLQHKGLAVELFPAESAREVARQNAAFNDHYFKQYFRDVMASPVGDESAGRAARQVFTATLGAEGADAPFMRRLRVNRFFIDHLGMEDIRTLCVHLQIPYGELTGDKVSSKSAQMIAEVERMGEEVWTRLMAALQTLFRDRWSAFTSGVPGV